LKHYEPYTPVWTKVDPGSTSFGSHKLLITVYQHKWNITWYCRN